MFKNSGFHIMNSMFITIMNNQNPVITTIKGGVFSFIISLSTKA